MATASAEPTTHAGVCAEATPANRIAIVVQRMRDEKWVDEPRLIAQRINNGDRTILVSVASARSALASRRCRILRLTDA
jgi:SOS response regulatory protein OraA/RecX